VGEIEGKRFPHMRVGKTKLRSLEKQVRDEVLKYPAWTILAQQAPDPNYVVDELGRVVKRDPPILRRF
jgi:hypothetical protein